MPAFTLIVLLEPCRCVVCGDVLAPPGWTIGEATLASVEHFAWEHDNKFARLKLAAMGATA